MENQQQQANLKGKTRLLEAESPRRKERIFMSQSTFRDIQHKFVVSLEITRITAIIIVITRITAITVSITPITAIIVSDYSDYCYCY